MLNVLTYKLHAKMYRQIDSRKLFKGNTKMYKVLIFVCAIKGININVILSFLSCRQFLEKKFSWC